ncbi:MAG TPA: glycosyltransferase family 39 protein, partial [Ktedonobacteraceae bacterium]
MWWQSWEFYLIALLAIVLRLYRIDTAQYMTDQNTFYQMAHDALAHGLWPISANRASTGALIPPLFVYVMMIPSAFTSNPVAGNILIALCNVAAVLLTYIFVRRYYGRLAGAISALLYATAVNVIIFSRDIWQPDLLPLFVILLLFMLFRGVVEGKRYWFLPAALLIGAMYQFHSTAIYLLAPLLVAVVLAYKTIRWRELPLAAFGLLLLYAPYIYLERHNQYADIRRLFQLAVEPAHFYSDALQLYPVFVQSFVLNPLHEHADTHLIPSNGHSILLTTPLRFIAQFAQPETWLMDLLLVGGIVTV